MPWYYCPGDELHSITLIAFSFLPGAGQPDLSSICTENGNIWAALWLHFSYFALMTQHNLRTTTLTRCKQFTISVHHTLCNYSVHQMSSGEEVWGSSWTFWVPGRLFQWEEKGRELLWEDGKEDEKSIYSLAVLQCFLTCIHKMCHRSCLGTLHLDEDLLFLLLLTKRRGEISDFHKRWLEVSNQVANYSK